MEPGREVGVGGGRVVLLVCIVFFCFFEYLYLEFDILINRTESIFDLEVWTGRSLLILGWVDIDESADQLS